MVVLGIKVYAIEGHGSLADLSDSEVWSYVTVEAVPGACRDNLGTSRSRIKRLQDIDCSFDCSGRVALHADHFRPMQECQPGNSRKIRSKPKLCSSPADAYLKRLESRKVSPKRAAKLATPPIKGREFRGVSIRDRRVSPRMWVILCVDLTVQTRIRVGPVTASASRGISHLRAAPYRSILIGLSRHSKRRLLSLNMPTQCSRVVLRRNWQTLFCRCLPLPTASPSMSTRSCWLRTARLPPRC